MRVRRWHTALPLMVALSGCALHGGASAPDEDEPKNGEAHVTVRAEPARTSTLAQTVEGLGRCESLPDRIATLTPAVEGHVHELLVAQGDTVKKGQPIVELDKAVAQADLAEKKATRDGLKASLALLESLPRPQSAGPTSWRLNRPRSQWSRPTRPPTASARLPPATTYPSRISSTRSER